MERARQRASAACLASAKWLQAPNSSPEPKTRVNSGRKRMERLGDLRESQMSRILGEDVVCWHASALRTALQPP